MTEKSSLDVRDKWLPKILENKNEYDLIYNYYRIDSLTRILWDEIAKNGGMPFTHILMTPEQATAVQYLICDSRLKQPTFNGAIIEVK